jgi:hypothetical protein
MATITRNAVAEIEREKDFTPEEAVEFLNKPQNFLSVSDGIKRELARHGYSGSDDELLKGLKKILKAGGFETGELRNANKWLLEDPRPNPKYDYPIRLCFAFGLSGQAALDFLWKVCRVNGFNFRRARDVVYCYCLNNGKSFADAWRLIAEYERTTVGRQASEEDATNRTQTLRRLFGDLAGVSEAAFLSELCANKKNFFEYSLTASAEYKRISESLKSFFIKDIAAHSHRMNSARMPGYNHEISLYPEIISAFERLSKAAKANKGETETLDDLMTRFPQSEYLLKMLNDTAAATDKEHDTARKVFILLFFAEAAFKRSKYLEKRPDKPREFFPFFYRALNDTLDKCGYAALYPANPYDWLILNCVRSLDVDNENELNPVELFDNTLLTLAGEEYL